MVLQQVSRRPLWKALGFLGLILLVAPAGAWYKHVASPRYHTVGRASGLLMGVRRSPYLWRRQAVEGSRANLEAAPTLPVSRATQWLALQQAEEEEERPWTTLDLQPHLSSQVGTWKDAAAVKRTLWPQASQKNHARHQGRIWAALCPPGCQEASWQSPAMHPELLERLIWKTGQLSTSKEASDPEI